MEANINPVVELQKIDANCNDCIFMQRDMVLFKKWESFHRDMQQADFDKRVAKLNKQVDAYYREQEFQKGFALEKELNSLKFIFDKSYVTINYGTCSKFQKVVSFIPVTTQLDTQECFKHRKDQI